MRKAFSVAGLALLLAGPAIVQASEEATAPAADATAAPVPAGGEATIVFFRPKKMVGAIIGFKVREESTDGKELGKLRNGTYFEVKAAPGTHRYVVHSEAKDVLTMEVEAGETYYVQGSLGMGVMSGRPNLAPSDKSTFESMKDKLKVAPPLTADDADDKSE